MRNSDTWSRPVGLTPIIVFVVTYALFLVSAAVFRLDRAWYDGLAKPSWTPSGKTIGLIWTVLFFCISLSLALIVAKVGSLAIGPWLIAAILANWFVNQAFSYVSFARRDWFTAGVDSALVAITAVLVAVLAWPISVPAALLYLPYAAWSTCATYLAFSIWSRNRPSA